MDGLLLLHAWPLDARMWEPQVQALSPGSSVVARVIPASAGPRPRGRS